mmetsp:Transcript_30046/g.48547  ORF Transcript_30046/g.48547 Transcript_30046/m.48547 type:complete len:306 (-) Transcript_30046:448-1365(-)
MFSYRSIPEQFQYFMDASLGGIELADFCPIYMTYSIRDMGRNTDCRASPNAPTMNFLGEKYCPGCRCFSTQGLAREGYVTQQVTACYDFSCEAGQLRVSIGGSWVDCPWSGGVVDSPDGYTGFLTCPPYWEMCDNPPLSREKCPNRCSGRGSCVNGACVCPPAWSGLGCDEPYCPDRYLDSACNTTGWWSGSVEEIPLEAYDSWSARHVAGAIALALFSAALLVTFIAAFACFVSAAMQTMSPERRGSRSQPNEFLTSGMQNSSSGTQNPNPPLPPSQTDKQTRTQSSGSNSNPLSSQDAKKVPM